MSEKTINIYKNGSILILNKDKIKNHKMWFLMVSGCILMVSGCILMFFDGIPTKPTVQLFTQFNLRRL